MGTSRNHNEARDELRRPRLLNTHFAGYRLGTTPQMHITYLMAQKQRELVGTTRIYTNTASTTPRPCSTVSGGSAAPAG